MGMGQNLVPLVNPKIAGKWMFIPLKMVLIGIDPYPYHSFIAVSQFSHLPTRAQNFTIAAIHLRGTGVYVGVRPPGAGK